MSTLEQKEIRNKRAREYYHKNKETTKSKNNERSKQYYKENRQDILERLSNCKERLHEYNKEYYQKNKDKLLERSKKKVLTPEEIQRRKEYMKEYRKKLKEINNVKNILNKNDYDVNDNVQ